MTPRQKCQGPNRNRACGDVPCLVCLCAACRVRVPVETRETPSAQGASMYGGGAKYPQTVSEYWIQASASIHILNTALVKYPKSIQVSMCLPAGCAGSGPSRMHLCRRGCHQLPTGSDFPAVCSWSPEASRQEVAGSTHHTLRPAMARGLPTTTQDAVRADPSAESSIPMVDGRGVMDVRSCPHILAHWRATSGRAGDHDYCLQAMSDGAVGTKSHLSGLHEQRQCLRRLVHRRIRGHRELRSLRQSGVADGHVSRLCFCCSRARSAATIG